MRKFLIALVVIGSMVLSACGGAAPTAPASSSPTQAPAASGSDPTAVAIQATEEAGIVSKPEEGKTNVTWWTHNNPAFVAANKEMIKRFEAANPDIHIVYQFFPYDIFINKLQTAYASQTEPDIQQMFGTWVTDYAKKGLLAEVTIPTGTLSDQFFPAALGAYMYEGKAYGIPHEYNLENGAMLVNPKMFQEAGLSYPKTWNDLIAASKKLTIWKGDSLERSGFAFTNNDSITFLYLSFILQQGGKFWGDDGQHVNFNTPEAKKAWAALTSLETTDKVTQEKSYPNLSSYEVFFQQKAAMAPQGPWTIGVGKESFPDLKYPSDYDYVPIPPFVDGAQLRFAAESGWGEVVSARSKSKEAAFKFVEFMAQPANARDWNITTFTVPALKSLQKDADFLKAAEAMKPSLDVLQYGEWVGPVQNRDRFWQIIHDHYTAVALGQENAADSPAKITDEINAMINEYLGP